MDASIRVMMWKTNQGKRIKLGCYAIPQSNRVWTHNNNKTMNNLFNYANVLLLGVLLAGVVMLASGCESNDHSSAPQSQEHHH